MPFKDIGRSHHPANDPNMNYYRRSHFERERKSGLVMVRSQQTYDYNSNSNSSSQRSSTTDPPLRNMISNLSEINVPMVANANHVNRHEDRYVHSPGNYYSGIYSPGHMSYSSRGNDSNDNRRGRLKCNQPLEILEGAKLRLEQGGMDYDER